MAFGVTNHEIVLEPHPPNSEESPLLSVLPRLFSDVHPHPALLLFGFSVFEVYMQTFGAQRQGSVAVYVAMCLLISAASSLFNPVLSFYLNTELGLNPLHISLFFILLPVATILVVQTVARFSDMGLQRPAIICIASLFGIASAFVLHLRPSFLLLCTVGLICLASYPVSFPQIFASAREYGIKHIKKGSLMFTTFLRSLASLSWVFGPPLSYGLALGVSFDMLFLVTALMFTCGCVTSYFFLPNVMDKSITAKDAKIAWWKNRSVMILFLSMAFVFTAFSSYITTIPLFVTQELKLPTDMPGYMFGLAAFLEIPLMFLAAKIAKGIGLKPVVMIGCTSLCIFLIGLYFLHTYEQIMALQLFSAIFIACVSSMGMVLFQELLPSIPGQSTSLFINSSTAGQIAGGALISLAASGTYLAIYRVSIAMAIVGTLMLFFVRKPPKAED